MKNYKIVLILLFITFSLYGQKMWKNDYNPRGDITNTEMKVEDAKQIILTKQSQGEYGYNEAVRFLYQFHRDSLSQFLLNHLNTPFSSKDYSKIYTDKYFRGLLGDTTAIQGMDSLTQYTHGTNKLFIIRKLTEVDIFNYYDFIIQGIQSANEEEKNIWYYTLSLYGADPLYKNEVSQILEQRIRAFVVNNEMDRTYWFSLIKNVSEFDKASAIRILEEYFFNSTGSEREEYYIELGLLDIEGQPERAKFALLNEQDDNFRKNYIPRPRYVRDGFYSKIFLDSSFIKFLNELELQPGSETYFIRKSFNNVYRPIKFDSSSSVEQNINSVINLIDTTFNYTWLGDLTFSNDLKTILTTAKTNLQNGDSLACRVQIKTFQDLVDNVYKDSLNTDPRFVTIEGWKFLYWNAQYILDRLPEPPANPNLVVNLKNSLGNQIPASNVKYYEGNWKDAVNNGDGTFTVITTRPTVSIRVFYEYASQQVDNVPAQNNTYTFTTVNAAVQLKNSLGNLIDQGTVQYYAGAWRSFGTTSNGVAYKELLPINYSFRMTYEYSSIDKQQNLSTDPTVVFQTVNASVQLKNSLGNLIDVGTVQYYAGAWRSFGTTSNGVAYKELLPINYSFRMTYEFVSKDKQQNLGTNPVVDFSTVLCSVKVSKTSDNQPLNNAAVKYYAGAWRNLGTTNVDGITTKELLPANISFRASYGNVSQDKQQDISVNNLVEILLNIP